MKEVFLAFAFTPQDRELANHVEQLLASHGLRISNGKTVGGQALTPAIKEIIDSSDGLIALLTRRDQIKNKRNKYTTHPWVIDELNHARGEKKETIALIENGVERGGMFEENEYIPLDRKDQLSAFLRLSETIGWWKRKIGRPVEAVILPEELGARLGQDAIKIRYRYVSKEGKGTPWQEADPIPRIGGTFVHLWGVKEDDSIQLEVTVDKKKWQSIASPQWVKIELK